MSHTFEVVVENGSEVVDYGNDIRAEVNMFMRMNPTVKAMKLIITEYNTHLLGDVFILDRIEV